MHEPNEINDLRKLLVDSLAISPNGIAVINKHIEPEKHTEDIQEIITKVPSWIVRWGITLLFSIILIIVAISVLVPYPEIYKSPLKLQSLGNTISIVADAPGHITNVFIKRNMVVKQGQPLIEVQKDIDQKSYIIQATGDGRVGFSAIVKERSIVAKNQEMFKIHPLNEQFYGVLYIPKNTISKIKVGQEVLVKLTSASTAGNAMKGKVDFVSDEPVNNLFLVKVEFINPKIAGGFEIKSWNEFEAEIITKKSNVFFKIFGSITEDLLSSKFNQ
ncbi:hypothetical protein GCM10027049_13220 [Mucilaginibacter puniceus]